MDQNKSLPNLSDLDRLNLNLNIEWCTMHQIQ